MSELLRRKTKIVATLGPATDGPGVLDALVAAGVDCARLNCSHGTTADLERRARAVRAAATRAGRPVGLLFDLQGPKLRLSENTAERPVQPGDAITFTSDRSSIGSDHATVDIGAFGRLVTTRSEIVIGDGLPRFAVDRANHHEVLARALTAGRLGPRKGVNVTYAQPELPAITDKDVRDLATAVSVGADFVALSFVRSGADLEDLRARLLGAGSRARIIAKIETVEAYENLDGVIAASDGVMVARGDLAVAAGLHRVPLMQKDIIARATQAGKLVITATQMLESMIDAHEPTRAEVADVANAVIDGTSAVMLSAETGIGSHPVETLRTMARIAQAAETSPVVHGRARVTPGDHDTLGAAVMHAAVHLAQHIGAGALVVPTTTGATARDCAKLRASMPVVALAHDPVVAAQMTLEWGVCPVLVEVGGSLDELADRAVEIVEEIGGLERGDRVVLTAGPRAFASGATNVVLVRELDAGRAGRLHQVLSAVELQSVWPEHEATGLA
jgi:pyruvate kinase